MRLANYLRALFLLTLLPCSLTGQERGDTVRLSGHLIAEFVRADSAGIHLNLEEGFVPYANISSLEVKTGTRSLRREGMWVGAAIGGGIGVIGGAIASASAGDATGIPFILPMGALAGAAGGVVGAVVGSTMHRPSFTPVLLPTMHPAFVVGPNKRFGVSVRFTF